MRVPHARAVKAVMFMGTIENVEGTVVGKCKCPSMFKSAYEFEVGAQADMLAQVLLVIVMNFAGSSSYAGGFAGA